MTQNFSQAHNTATAVFRQVEKAVLGKNDVIFTVLTAFIADGHILLEDMPGVGKTTMALAFSKAMGLTNARVQFTPDVMPSDLTGFSVYQKSTERFVFRPGALFTQLLLADEINRTSSRTQAALLEAMEEGTVSVEGKTYNLPNPHLVIATENPLQSVGTQPLPESQLDRFLVRLHMGYPGVQEEASLLRDRAVSNPLDAVQPVCSPEQLLAMQQCAANVHVDERIYVYAASIAKATREHPKVNLGISPRGTLALLRMAKAMALLRGREYVLPDDLANVAHHVMDHRILPKRQESVVQIVDDIFAKIQVPTPTRR